MKLDNSSFDSFASQITGASSSWTCENNACYSTDACSTAIKGLNTLTIQANDTTLNIPPVGYTMSSWPSTNDTTLGPNKTTASCVMAIMGGLQDG